MPVRSVTPWSGRRNSSLSPINQFEEFINEFDRAFALPRTSPAGSMSGGEFAPALDFEEQADAYMIAVDLPGLKKEDIKLDLDNNVLTISGERLRDAGKEGRYSERPSGKFARVLTLPSQVNSDKIQAHFTNGVLNITVPKAEGAKSHSIKIM